MVVSDTLPEVTFMDFDGEEDMDSGRLKFFTLKGKDDKNKVGLIPFEEPYEQVVAKMNEAQKKKLANQIKRGRVRVVQNAAGVNILQKVRFIAARVHSSRDTGAFYCWGGECCELAKESVPNPDKPGKTKNLLTTSTRAITMGVVYDQNLKAQVSDRIEDNGVQSDDDYSIQIIKVYQKLYGSLQDVNQEFPLLTNDCIIKMENPDFYEYKGSAAQGSFWQENDEIARKIIKNASAHWESLPYFLAKRKSLDDVLIDLKRKEPKKTAPAPGIDPGALGSELGDALDD